jgi:hypothetical protein
MPKRTHSSATTDELNTAILTTSSVIKEKKFSKQCKLSKSICIVLVLQYLIRCT